MIHPMITGQFDKGMTVARSRFTHIKFPYELVSLPCLDGDGMIRVQVIALIILGFGYQGRQPEVRNNIGDPFDAGFITRIGLFIDNPSACFSDKNNGTFRRVQGHF